MITTREKVKRLEQYLTVDNAAVDPVLDMALNKLLSREHTRMFELKTRLKEQLAEFEQCYSLSSPDFYRRYEHGEMGDEIDFIEWASTVDMLANVDKRLALLDIESSS